MDSPEILSKAHAIAHRAEHMEAVAEDAPEARHRRAPD